jgi:hypothetical protein
MKIYESIGYDGETTEKIVVGYFIEGGDGKYAFSPTPDNTGQLVFNIDLQPDLPYIVEYTP